MENDPTIAAFARDLQDAASATPAPAVGASLAAVLDGRVPTDVYPEVVLPGHVRTARRSLRLRWAVASAAFGIGAGSLGVAGALPGPVQRQVARMAEVVGVDLPDGQPTTTTTVTPPPVTVPASTSVPPRPTVVPAGEPPVAPPTTLDDEQHDDELDDDRGRGEDRGRADDDDAVDVDGDADHGRDEELESDGPDGVLDDRGPEAEDDRSGSDQGSDDPEDEGDDDPEDDDEDEAREP
ncbi:MAG TPA: hypothetical protein VFU93_00235 [Acidimicrobiales bacterium]|nr:hypothetical protein [Acidimicrobiales bacterium]